MRLMHRNPSPSSLPAKAGNPGTTAAWVYWMPRFRGA
jgi:hypothetical protein